MAWQEEMTLKLRAYINDLDDENPTYTDEKLQKWILLSLSLMQLEFTFPFNYYVDVINGTITPDPTLVPRDEACIGLTILKAGLTIMNTESRIYGGQAIAIKDDDSSIDLRRDIKSIIEIANGFEKSYNLAKYSFLSGKSIGGSGFAGGAVDRCYEYLYENYWEGWEFSWRRYE